MVAASRGRRGASGSNIIIKTPEQIERMKVAGRVVRTTLMAMGDAIVPGKSTTQDLEKAAIAVITGAGASSAFLGYAPHGHPPYPAWTCISVNEEVVHGIPGRRLLSEGDIVSCDVGVELNGCFADAAWTFPVGRVRPEVDRLLHVAEESLYLGIAEARHGRQVGDIGYAIERHVAKHGCSVVRDLVGHGVGLKLHEDPQIPNFGRRGTGPLLSQGATLAIEPMVNMGRYDVEAMADEWTIVTCDRKPSAHFEHTVVVTRTGGVILTQGD
jgi:methionyl aminopeptidase